MPQIKNSQFSNEIKTPIIRTKGERKADNRRNKPGTKAGNYRLTIEKY